MPMRPKKRTALRRRGFCPGQHGGRGMDTIGRAQVIWAETKDLQVADGGDAATLSALRRHIATVADESEKSFPRFDPLPSRDDPDHAAAIADCAAAVEGPTPDDLKNLRVIVWPSADGKTLNQAGLKSPSPWDAAAPETLKLIGRYNIEGRDVSAFSRPIASGEDAPRFVSLVTGTGLPPGTGVYVPPVGPRVAVSPRAAKTAFWLAMLMLAMFAAACIWSLSVGNATRAAERSFEASGAAANCSTNIDPANPATLYGAPRAWLFDGAASGDCLKAWTAATATALKGGDGDWWSALKRTSASWTVADAGRAFSLRMPLLLMMAAFVLLAISAGMGVLGRPLGLFIDRRNRMSLTRIQFAIWLVILMSGIASYALFNVGFWAEDLNRIREGMSYLKSAGSADQHLAGWADRLSGLLDFLPKMDTALWLLIGITGGTTVVSSFLTAPGTPAAADKSETLLPARRVGSVVNKTPDDAALADLVYGETEENADTVDASRVQTVAITGVLAAIYLNLVLEAADGIGGLSAFGAVNAGQQVLSSMPPAGTTFLWLLGISHATLMGGKLFSAYKAPTAQQRSG
jgi:hypothetical protein